MHGPRGNGSIKSRARPVNQPIAEDKPFKRSLGDLAFQAKYCLHRLAIDRMCHRQQLRYLLIPMFNPGEMQSIYYLDRESEDIWRYYGIVGTGKIANGLIPGNDSSSINRAVAFYRHLVGIPTNQEPPAAR
jgi:hypothetical protein